VYSNANGSIAGNDPHNPFLTGTATFDLAVLGLTEASTITSAIFSFGTTEGNDVPGTRVPEPSTGPIFLISGVLAAIVTARLRRRGTAGQRS
jgi:hypothetical protein